MRKEVEEFAEMMEYKLDLHDDRPGWKETDPAWLLAQLKEEVAEVEKALQDRGGGWLTKLRLECADVGNFAMMVQDAVLYQWAKKKAEEYAPAWVGGSR